ncbi:CD109 antigen-like [Alosa pseudoharengus]|uniref:CD109 antigen-like n=1 Tax=Alosa pseudoharengus TaxID=34774 RepID=UPI003F8CA354
MEWNRMITVCLLLAGSAAALRNSSSSYIIMAPRELHLGVPTALSVTILANSTITVKAELQGTDGSLTLAQSTLDGGSTGVLMIPSIEVAFVSQRLSYRLVLKGYEGTRLLFTDDTTLTLSQNTPSTLVWTPQSHYRPSQTVQIQVQPVHSGRTPYRGKVDITVQVKISRVDQKPLRSSEREKGVHVRVVQLRAQQQEQHEDSGPQGPGDSVAEVATRDVTHTLPEDGKLPIQFHIQEEAEKIIIQVEFMSAEKILVLCRTSVSPSGSNIQICPPSQLAQHASSVHLCYTPMQVTSSGQVVATGRETSSAVLLTPAQSWTPEACLILFHQLTSGQVLGDQVEYKTSSPEAEYACNLAVLTDASLQQCGQIGAFEYVVGQAVINTEGEEKTRRMETEFSDPSIWMRRDMSDIKATSLHLVSAVPFSLRKAKATVLLSGQNPGPVSRLRRATDDKTLTWSVHLPPSLIKGEELILEVRLLNHLQNDTEVIVVVEESQMFELVLTDTSAVSTPNKQTLKVRALGQAWALFPIRPLVVGEISFSILVMSSEIQDSTMAKLLVVPEGHQQTFSQSLFLDIPPTGSNLSREQQFTLPHGVVPNTQRAHVAVAGDILGPSIAGLALLIQMPHGCGEQNMIQFAPSIYVLQYLSRASVINKEIAGKALAYMKEGYNRELSYLRDDGSFSGFGQRDPSGSTWLTAFVLRCFLQAQAFMQIDQSMLSKALSWLAEQQTPDGSFTEPGRVIHTELQGGLGDQVSLTAYVLITLLEDQAQMGLFPGNLSKATEFLETQLSSGISSNYSLSLVSYALSLASSLSTQNAIDELISRADIRDGVPLWSSRDADLTESWQPSSASVEIAGYVLLSRFKQGNIVESIDLMKWLSSQRGPSGGFGSTQDTVIALQALSLYASFSGSEAINLKMNLTSKASPMVTSFTINSTNYLTVRQQQIDMNTSVHIDIFIEGKGFALFQMNIFYNLESLALSQAQRHATSHEAFELRVKVLDEERDTNHILLSICTKLLDSQSIKQTGMALLDVQILSGFTLRPNGIETNDLVKSVEPLPGRVVLYLDSLGKAEKCVNISLVRQFKVAHVQPALIQVFDYYEPRRKAVRLYHSKVMRDLPICTFCGDTCDQCWGKISTSDTTTINSRNSGIYSLGCLLLFVVRM